MNPSVDTATSSRPQGPCHGPYLLRFESLFHSGRGLSFPCDARGQVVLDQLSERARENYLFARAVVGHEYATPVVERCYD
ncbi:hypothetical protein OU995_13135 [Roseateles sp. SL47]|jgi:hypothetical protein|uniref:hypothetical protein n=1 Tax=Roseateles sp. SL47 TaxID=2995138 RepID=UPI002271412D|nr:hypothetical protein [Roseateles sp. SL47]WAC75580.1 hypothetical protein OU995_13135 [Roseateles sp. SL47]